MTLSLVHCGLVSRQPVRCAAYEAPFAYLPVCLTSVPQPLLVGRSSTAQRLVSSVQVRGAIRMMSMSVMNKMPVAAEDEVGASRSHQQQRGCPAYGAYRTRESICADRESTVPIALSARGTTGTTRRRA